MMRCTSECLCWAMRTTFVKISKASFFLSSVLGRTVRCARAVPALCKKSAVFHDR